MAKVIAVVRLAPGQVAFFDEKTSLHLTMSNPIGNVLDYFETTRIRRAVNNKILNLVQGSFDVENVAVPKEQKVNIEVKPKEVKQPKVEEPKADQVEVIEEVREIKVEAPAVEESAEEVAVESPVEETEEIVESKPKAKRKKKEE